ncbi:MAG: response regulator transcription factor [Deltaproteobacteria bacterium]|nr:response regulator transcription factor [Deltaproteobacteria bacterium]
MVRIICIEDEEDLQKILSYNLKQAGHDVWVAATGQEGLKLASEKTPALVLLDLMLPDISGNEICKTLKRQPKTAEIPIIMLTAKGEEIDRIVGFELGVDDYVVKPFSIRELMLRIDVILRRNKKEVVLHKEFVFGVLRVDLDAHRVFVNEQEILLTTLERKLLITLFSRKNRVQERSVLLEDVWGIEADITTRTIDTHVKRLREKLGKAGDYIETIRGVGYRFAEHP